MVEFWNREPDLVITPQDAGLIDLRGTGARVLLLDDTPPITWMGAHLAADLRAAGLDDRAQAARVLTTSLGLTGRDTAEEGEPRGDLFEFRLYVSGPDHTIDRRVWVERFRDGEFSIFYPEER